MSIFKPVNSSESNLFTIRLTLGIDSSLGVFNTTTNLNENCIIASNDSTQSVTKDLLSSPSNNNLPKNFVLKYDLSSKSFKVTYGKNFVQQPNINITPHLSIGSFAINTIKKNSISATSDNLEINFLDTNGAAITPSSDGTSGLLGFDLVITGPVKLGATIGNSNKGWSITDNGDIYSSMDLNFGSSNISENSVIISKNLKFLDSGGAVKKITGNTISTSDYTNTVWELVGGIAVTDVTPQIGMILIIFKNSTSVSTLALSNNCFFNGSTTDNKITFSNELSSVILYGASATSFIVLSTNGSPTIGA